MPEGALPGVAAVIRKEFGLHLRLATECKKGDVGMAGDEGMAADKYGKYGKWGELIRQFPYFPYHFHAISPSPAISISPFLHDCQRKDPSGRPA
jgi:hypothetical protein